MPDQSASTRNEHHKRLPDFADIDRVEIEVVPRFKESYLSGDEWRQSFVARLYFKGEQVGELGAGRKLEDIVLKVLNTAMGHTEAGCVGGTEEAADSIIRLEKGGICDQPGCPRPSVVRRYLKREFSDCGDMIDESDTFSRKYRQFCSDHMVRGDSSREDCDANYEEAQHG